MVGTVVVVADYLPILNRTRACLLQAGHRVLSTSHLPAGYPMVRLYLPDAIVVLDRLGAAAANETLLKSLADDDTTRTLPVMMLSAEDCGKQGRGSPNVTFVDPFDTSALLRAIDRVFMKQAVRTRDGQVWAGA